MIELKKRDHKNTYAFTVDESMNEHDMRELYELLQEKSTSHKELRLLGEIKVSPA